MEIDYRNKYLKYKYKYLILKGGDKKYILGKKFKDCTKIDINEYFEKYKNETLLILGRKPMYDENFIYGKEVDADNIVDVLYTKDTYDCINEDLHKAKDLSNSKAEGIIYSDRGQYSYNEEYPGMCGYMVFSAINNFFLNKNYVNKVQLNDIIEYGYELFNKYELLYGKQINLDESDIILNNFNNNFTFEYPIMPKAFGGTNLLQFDDFEKIVIDNINSNMYIFTLFNMMYSLIIIYNKNFYYFNSHTITSNYSNQILKSFSKYILNDEENKRSIISKFNEIDNFIEFIKIFLFIEDIDLNSQNDQQYQIEYGIFREKK